MNLWAKIRLGENENTQQILQAFFKEFYKNSSILVKGKKVFLEITFDEQHHPTEIPAAIGAYKDIEFGYGELPEEGKTWFGDDMEFSKPPEVKKGKEDEKKKTRPKQQDSRQKNTKGEGAGVPPSKNEAGTGRRSKKAPSEIPELVKIAQSTNSFNTFIDAVANWFEIGNKRTELFKHLVKTAVNLEKVNWVTLAQALEKQDIQLKEYAKICLTRQVAKKLDEVQSNGSILSVIKIVSRYHDFDFAEVVADSKIKDILMRMGLEEETPENQNIIIRIANAGVKKHATELGMDYICIAADLGDKICSIDARMIFANFVDRNHKDLSSIDFIKKLKEMLAEETV
jgi:hypothetical protein